jgi:hypothetical protein
MVRPWSEDLMPLRLAATVFKRSVRSLWYLRRQGHIEIVTLVGAAYVRLSTLKKHFGESTYALCMRSAPSYDEKTGWLDKA